MKKLILLLIFFIMLYRIEFVTMSNNYSKINNTKPLDIISLAPPNIQAYLYICKYAKEYHVPEYIAFGMAKAETNFRDPLDFNYNSAQTSKGHARGILQIQTPTGRDVSGDETLTDRDLLYNNELNVKLGMQYISNL